MVSNLTGIYRWAVIALAVCCNGVLLAQGSRDIPLGTWRGHFSFNKLVSIANSAGRVWVAGEHGLMVLSRDDFSVVTITSLNGLKGDQLLCLGVSDTGDMAIVGYESGRINVVRSDEIMTFDRFKSTNSIAGSRRINQVLTSGQVAYLACDFGIALFDLAKLELKDTYRDLGINGSGLRIFGVAIVNDSLYAATEQGVIGCALEGANLLDYRNWKRYDQGALAQPVTALVASEGHLYAAIDGDGVYKKSGGAWQLQPWLQGSYVKSLSASAAGLVVTTSSQVAHVDASGSFTTVASELISAPAGAMIDANGKFWIADNQNGLISDAGGAFENFLPNGPSSNRAWRITSVGGVTTVVQGGIGSLELPERARGIYDQFESGVWTASWVNSVEDLTDVSTTFGTSYLSSYGHGVIAMAGDQQTIFDEHNSPLINSAPPQRNVLITAIESSPDGLWVANYNSSLSLHLLKPDQNWQSYDLQIPQAHFPVDIKVDLQLRPWVTIAPDRGGGVLVFDREQNKVRHFTSTPGAGGLPSHNVRSMAVAKDGSVWFGTDQGVAYISSELALNSSGDVIKPIFDNRFLLRDEVVTAIAVDAGNRKWMGTLNGVWLFDSNAEEIIHQLDMENSPLPSNQITGISIDEMSGEVFFATEGGMVSFRSDATKGESDFLGIKIFPNPVLRDFNGMVAITGLYDHARVKITDISGKLIWETQANGGTATWNVRKTNGDRVATGMYLVFATSPDGNEKHVGKIAVVN